MTVPCGSCNKSQIEIGATIAPNFASIKVLRKRRFSHLSEPAIASHAQNPSQRPQFRRLASRTYSHYALTRNQQPWHKSRQNENQ
jgi:hypothetical protein